MDRKVTSKSFIYLHEELRRNLSVTFLSTEREVQISSAIKHLTRISEIVDEAYMKVELDIVIALLSNRVNEIICQFLDMKDEEEAKLISVLITFKGVMTEKDIIDQKPIVKQAFRLGKFIFETKYKREPALLGWIQELLFTLIQKGIYEDDYVRDKLQKGPRQWWINVE